MLLYVVIGLIVASIKEARVAGIIAIATLLYLRNTWKGVDAQVYGAKMFIEQDAEMVRVMSVLREHDRHDVYDSVSELVTKFVDAYVDMLFHRPPNVAASIHNLETFRNSTLRILSQLEYEGYDPTEYIKPLSKRMDVYIRNIKNKYDHDPANVRSFADYETRADLF